MNVFRSVVESAAMRKPILTKVTQNGLEAFKHPLSFLGSRTFAAMIALYGVTYAVANSAETCCSEFSNAVLTGPIVFSSTFAVNVPLGVWKDVQYSKLYGSAVSNAARAEVKKIVLRGGLMKGPTGAFLLRDAVTIAGSFTMPEYVAQLIPHHLVPDASNRQILTQLTVPMLSQVFATPIHLVGLDSYTYQDNATLRERLLRTRVNTWPTMAARCIRTVPAFGVGVLANRSIRGKLHDAVGD